MKHSEKYLNWKAENRVKRAECEKNNSHEWEMSHVGVEYCKICGKGKPNPNREKRRRVIEHI